MSLRSVAGGYLLQGRDDGRAGAADLKVVTTRAPSAAELADLLFAFRVAKHVKSSAIVYAKAGATVGIGAGQMSRVDSARIAVLKAKAAAEAAGEMSRETGGETGDAAAARTQGSVVASDAFFPFADGPQILIDAAGVPKEEFKGAVGFGWNPVLDLRLNQNPLDGPYSSQARRHCRQLLTSKGAQFPDANAEAVGNLYCNSLYLLRDALKSQNGKVSRDSFFAGLHALGSSFEPAGAFGTSFSPDQHDGGNGYYHYAYNDSCGCFGYTGSLQRTDG